MTKSAELDPETSLGYLVRCCHRRFDRTLNAYLSQHGVKSGFWYYLRVLWSGDGVTQKYLSDTTNVTEATTVTMIGGMVKAGLVERCPDPADRRKLRIVLTKRGKTLESTLMHFAIEINEAAVEGIDPSDVETCKRVLTRMSENLSRELTKVQVAG